MCYKLVIISDLFLCVVYRFVIDIFFIREEAESEYWRAITRDGIPHVISQSPMLNRCFAIYNKLAKMRMQSLSEEVADAVRRALTSSWSERTSVCFNPNIAPRSYGQCAPTAIVVNEMFGGEILRTEAIRFDGFSIRHFYNRIDGKRYDFTADQFDVPNYLKEFTYKDIPSSVKEALTEMLPGQIDAMRVAFAKEMGAANVR